MCMYLIHIKTSFTYVNTVTYVHDKYMCIETPKTAFAFHYVHCTMYVHIYLLFYLQYSFETTSHDTI